VNWTADRIHRTAKMLIDAGIVRTPAEATHYLERLVLQVAVGPELEFDEAAQAALATIVNTAHRAFLGGVHVMLEHDPILRTGWTDASSASQVVERFGGRVVDQLLPNRPTLTIGRPATMCGSRVLHLVARGWCCAVVQSDADATNAHGNAIAGVASAALGVSEMFQNALGAVMSGRRDVGISVWRPDIDWRTAEAEGPPLQYLPASMWLLGLGHLGQAYGWTTGMLPYEAPGDVELGLVDFDTIVQGNVATQPFAADADAGRRKTRGVGAALETRGFRMRHVERAFDEHFHPVPHAKASRNEPAVALGGFDVVEPRRLLGNAGFSRVVDGGLGAGPVEYLDMVIHTFPAREDASTAFNDTPHAPRALPDAYEAEIESRVRAGEDETAARCGMLDIAGVTVGAAFVGAFASTVVVADILRLLHGGRDYAIVAVDLRNPSDIRCVANANPGKAAPRFTGAR
jgi:hypothetical protein